VIIIKEISILFRRRKEMNEREEGRINVEFLSKFISRKKIQKEKF